ncbi:MAG TPA: hypothetical protein PK869_13410, partial [Candidatus Hydrogenedentes bacterium]|nr:hypothetical protein [Candidatus Hydrogenedentota bacterium]
CQLGGRRRVLAEAAPPCRCRLPTAVWSPYRQPDDVRQMAIPILSHRILVKSRDGNPIASARARSRVIHEVLKQVPAPE